MDDAAHEPVRSVVRPVRLLVQPALVVWALWSTGAWRAWRGRLAA